MIGQKGMILSGKAGGIEKHVAEIAPRLVEMGHSVTVFARAKYDPKRQTSVDGVKVRFLPTLYTKYTEAIVHTFLATWQAVWRGYDIYHYHGVGPATLSWLPRIFRPKATVIATFHSQDKLHSKWGWFARAYLSLGERAAVWFPQYTIAVSHQLQVYCRDELHREAVYIPNGAEVKHVEEDDLIEKLGLRPNEYLLTVGRILPLKGLHFLIEAFKESKTEKELVIVGGVDDEDYAQELQELAAGDSRIRFLGFQSGETLDQLFAHAYLFIHPSTTEGLSLAVLEAMSHGTAPLVSDIPANIEAAHSAGFIFKSGNVADLQLQLENLLEAPEIVSEQAEEARAIIEVHFNWQVAAEHTESVYITSRH